MGFHHPFNPHGRRSTHVPRDPRGEGDPEVSEGVVPDRTPLEPTGSMGGWEGHPWIEGRTVPSTSTTSGEGTNDTQGGTERNGSIGFCRSETRTNVDEWMDGWKDGTWTARTGAEPARLWVASALGCRPSLCHRPRSIPTPLRTLDQGPYVSSLPKGTMEGGGGARRMRPWIRHVAIVGRSGTTPPSTIYTPLFPCSWDGHGAGSEGGVRFPARATCRFVDPFLPPRLGPFEGSPQSPPLPPPVRCVVWGSFSPGTLRVDLFLSIGSEPLSFLGVPSMGTSFPPPRSPHEDPDTRSIESSQGSRGRMEARSIRIHIPFLRTGKERAR